MDELHRAAQIYRNHPDYAVPGRVIEEIKELLASGRYGIFSE